MLTEYIDEAVMPPYFAFIDAPGLRYLGEIPDRSGVWAGADKRVRQAGIARDQWTRD